ncbi:SseB family protein [Actinomadura viridis]|uniref:SseB family protein n=1 Tax=Actinomadura viridis TaxID=58110 RepID=UPI0036BF7648
MAIVADAWRPTSELERRLQETVRTGDQEAYFRLLADSELVIPVAPELVDCVLADQARPGWPIQEVDGRTHVLAYTSAAAMRRCLGPAYRHFLRLKFADLAETWPDSRWWLAVDAPGAGYDEAVVPIEARLPAWFIRQVMDGDSRPPTAGRAVPVSEPAATGRTEVPRDAARDVAREVTSQVTGEVTSHVTGEVTSHVTGGGSGDVPHDGARDVPREARRGPAHAAGKGLGKHAAPPDPARDVPVPPGPGAAGTPGTGEAPGPSGLPAAVPGPAAAGPGEAPVPSGDAAPVQGGAVESTEPPAEGTPAAAPEPFGGTPREPNLPDLPHHPEGEVAPALGAGAAEAPPAAEVTRLDGIPPIPADDGTGADAAPWEELQEQHRELPREPARRPGFQPANEVEEALLRAAAGNDYNLFLETLADAEVLLPIPDEMDYALRPGRPGFPWQTRDVDGTTVIPVFTSRERLVEAAASTGTGTDFITLPFTVVMRYAPDRNRPLAVNSGSPAGGTILAEQLPGLATWADQRAARRMSHGFEPQNDVEQRLFDAAVRRDTDAFFKVLLGAQVLVPAEQETPWGIVPADPEFPWRPVPVHGRVSVQVFTSLKWMNEAIGSSRFVMPSFLEMVSAWPDAEWTLVLNPGTPIDATMPGEQVRALSGPPRTEPPEPPAAPPGSASASAPAAAAPAPGPAGPASAEPPAADPVAAEPVPLAEPAAPAAPVPDAADVPPVPPTPPSPPAPAAVPDAAPSPAGPSPAAPGPDAAQPPAPTPAEPIRAEDPSARRTGPRPVPDAEFEPGNRIDQELYEAALAGDSDAFLRILLGANVLVPIPADAPLEVTPVQREFRWEAALREDEAVQVFTSLVRLQEILPESRFVYADFRELIGSWPRHEWAMLLNPGTRIGASLRGDQVRALSEWAVQVGLLQPRPEVPTPPPSHQQPAPQANVAAPPADAPPSDVPAPAPAPAPAAEPEPTPPPAPEPVQAPAPAPANGVPEPAEPRPLPAPAQVRAPAGPPQAAPLPEPDAERVAEPTIMQKVVSHRHVDWYLEQGYDRVGGFVHPTSDVAELQTPIQLYEALGLLYEDSPFQPGDEGVHVIRWPAYCPDLYRIPFGGQTEEELASWGDAGWVVERAPFHGSGFAPGSAGSIREYKVDSVRLPYGAEMYYLGLDRTERFVAMYDPDRLAWLRPENDADWQDEGDGQGAAQ